MSIRMLRSFLLALAVSAAAADWLLDPNPPAAQLVMSRCTAELTNGLISRLFSLPGPGCPAPEWATIDLRDRLDQQHQPRSALAAFGPEGVVELDGRVWQVGGYADACPASGLFDTCTYLNRSQPSNAAPSANLSAFRYTGHTTGPITPQLNYSHARHAARAPWPPRGLHLAVSFEAPEAAPAAVRAVSVTVHYEMLQGIPAMRKWLTVSTAVNGSGATVVGAVTVERLRVNDDYAGTSYAVAEGWRLGGNPPLLFAQVDVPYGAGCGWSFQMEHTYNANPILECGYTGPKIEAQCHPNAHPAEVCPGSGLACPACGKSVCPCPASEAPPGPHVSLEAASSSFFHPRSPDSTADFVFESFRVELLVLDSTEQERRGLALRRLTKLTKPWVTENPLFMHLTDSSDAGVRQAVEDAQRVGLEMIIQSFGTSFQMENNSDAYLAKIRNQTEMAKERGVEIGGYDLIVLDRAGLGYDRELVASDGSVGGSACFASRWVDELVPEVQRKVQAGLAMVETDGPYGGGICTATNHTHHKGLQDSTYWQTRLQSEWYSSLRAQGVFINAPDRYFSSGSNKMMFYGDPTNFGRARRIDLTLSRQMLYDSTFEWLPTQGWSLVPIQNYGGGGAEAAFSPLEEHHRDYDLAWAIYMGMGVSGVCWRGPRVFEGPKSQAAVSRWISWYKRYRDTLTSDMLVHLRRPDGQSIDAVLHANSAGGSQGERGILFAFNPTTAPITANLSVPLYYTGLTQTATVSQGTGEGTTHRLRRDYSITVEASIEANNYSWWVIS